MEPIWGWINAEETGELQEVLVAPEVMLSIERLDNQERAEGSEPASFQHSRDCAVKQLITNLLHLRTAPPEAFA